VRWDKPAVYGVACKRIDVRERQSIFNSRPQFAIALQALLSAVRAPTLIISFSNEGYISREDMEAMLRSLWNGAANITTIENNFKRYIGAQIGIYNPQGEKVGKVSHLSNKEYLYIVSRDCVPQPASSS
jgi:adenine-specific DNA-methyltransferase